MLPQEFATRKRQQQQQQRSTVKKREDSTADIREKKQISFMTQFIIQRCSET
jgi:hypothetical protein